MPALIDGATCIESWVRALDHLVAHGGTDTALMVCVREPCQKVDQLHTDITGLVDELLHAHDSDKAQLTQSVANTIFPAALYRPGASDARTRLYQLYEQNWPLLKRHPANRRGTYFRRLSAYPIGSSTVNQLDQTITRLQGELRRPNPKHANYELSIRIPGKDRTMMGFPCLSHISLTLKERQVYLTAVYRNQHFIHKALGNYLGLSRLLSFVCQEVGLEAGTLTCLAAHADAELSSFGKRKVTELVVSANALLQPSASATYVTGRAA